MQFKYAIEQKKKVLVKLLLSSYASQLGEKNVYRSQF